MTTDQKARLAALTVADLVSGYNGRPGCACGCRGTHSYMDAAEGTRRRGYAVEPHEVSPRRVANTLRTIQAHAGEAEWIGTQIRDGGDIFAYESATRLYVVYAR